MNSRPTVRLELPFSSKREARLRGIDLTFGRLILTFDDPQTSHHEMSSYLWTCRKSSDALYALAVNEFVSVATVIQHSNVARSSILAVDGHVRVTDAFGLKILLDHWRAEQLIFVFASAELEAPEIPMESQWWKWTTEGNEAGYLKGLAAFDPIIFYSDTLSSLEIVGSSQAILRCFGSARELLR